MRTLILTALGAAGALALATPAAAQGRTQQGGGQGAQIPQIKTELQLWHLELDGRFGISQNGGSVPRIDLAGDVDLDDEFLAGGLRVSLGDIRMGWLEFGYFRFVTTGKRFLHQPLTIRGVTYPADTLLRTRLDFRWSELVLGQLYGYGGGYYIGYEVGGADYRYRLRLRDAINGGGDRIDETPTMPLVGVKLGIGMGQAVLFLGSLRGNFFNFGNLDSNVIEATIELRMQFAPWGLLHVGWQYFSLDAEFSLGADTGETRFFVQGPFLGLEIRVG